MVKTCETFCVTHNFSFLFQPLQFFKKRYSRITHILHKNKNLKNILFNFYFWIGERSQSLKNTYLYKNIIADLCINVFA